MSGPGHSGPHDGWSAPALYAGADRLIEPRLFTEADPMSPVLLADWSPPDVGAQWSVPTYIGKRRLRPGTVPAAATIDAAREGEPGEPPPDAKPPGGGDADSEQAQQRLMADSRSMAIASLVSRVTGFLRSVLLVAALGIGAVGNAYSGGNTFPNMVYELLLGGVLTSVLIPLLVHAQVQDTDGGTAYTQRLLSLATAALGGLTLLAVAAAPLIAGAFVPAGPQRELTTVFATLLLPEIFFYGLGAMFMAVLNIKNVYRPGAWSPVLNNVIMIVTILVFWALPGPSTLSPSNITTPQILVMGIGTTLGIVAQAMVLVPALRRSGFRWHWRFRALPNEVGRMKQAGTLAGWVLGYVLASQIGVSVIQKVGFDNGGLTVFTQTDLLFQVPYGILVVSLLTAIMPRMSRAAVRGDNAAVVADLALGTRLAAVALVPITAGLIALGTPLAVTLFAHGSTTFAGGELIGSSLALSAFGLLPFAIVMLQLRVFYAIYDGRTPALINIFMVGTKVVLVLVTNAAFRAPKGTNVDLHPSVHAVQWLNIATSLSYVVGAIVGHVLLTRRLGLLGYRSVAITTVRIGLASLVGALAAYAFVVGARSQFGPEHVGALVGLFGGGVVGLAVMLAVAWGTRIPEIRDVRSLLRR
ncbi:MAG: murein biosynthesis integral membrane protein MurJ [Jatrophihabitantaceae bacterium]